ncbi:MAG: hypothetical protein AABY86_14600, partial [Bdellovibrionota bacterium]
DGLGVLGKKRYESKGNLRSLIKRESGVAFSSSKEQIDFTKGGVVDDPVPDVYKIPVDLQIEGSDIIQDSEVSIFRIISKRYLQKFLLQQ